MSIILLALTLVLTAALTGVASRFINWLPLPLMQIGTGALLALPFSPLQVPLHPGTFMLLFVPPLLFAEAWRFPQRELMSLRHPIIALAVGLVLFTVVLLGLFIHWLLPGLPPAVCFALAAIVSPTDAVAVAAISGRLGMPARLMHILDGESLMNDASGLVALKFAVAAIMTGSFSIGQASLDFMLMTAIGVAVGTALAFIFSTLRRLLLDKRGVESSIEIVLLMLVVPFATYLVADRLGGSGILAAVAAGITINRTELKRHAQSQTRMQLNHFWEMLTFLLNALVFIVLGLQLPNIIGGAISVSLRDSQGFTLGELLLYVGAITAVLLVLRFFWIGGAIWLSRLSRRRRRAVQVPFSTRVTSIGTLAGIRGTITLAAALSLPLALPDGSALPGRELVVFLATGVILLTLLLGSLGLPLLLRGLDYSGENWRQEEISEARQRAFQTAIRAIERWHEEAAERHTGELERSVLTDTSTRMIGYYRNLMTIDDQRARSERHELDQRFSRQARLEALRAERHEYYRLRAAHRIDDDTLRRLVHELDLVEMALTSRTQ
ncbi:Na+/H+ antiporter [Kushneria aurantia]|uniref:Na+/H+ antiporter n=1 Tax=Kushneria aurantia TaxID=504092 RepID=A0ABV6G791_9GAMM|nr:Na+/H+ antiporter [Kushneria aurantia]